MFKEQHQHGSIRQIVKTKPIICLEFRILHLELSNTTIQWSDRLYCDWFSIDISYTATDLLFV